MRFFSRRRASSDSRRRQVRPELELLESRIVPSSGLQGSGGVVGGLGYLGASGQNASLTPPSTSVDWLSTLQGDLEYWTTIAAGEVQAAEQWITSVKDRIFALFSQPQLPPSQLPQVPSPGGLNGGGLGGGFGSGSHLHYRRHVD
jgi:hypothetical protein